MLTSTTSRRWLIVGVWSVVALGVLRTSVNAVRAIGAPSFGFVAYYTASRAILEGAPAERFYEDDWFRGQTARFEPQAQDIFNANPPPMAAIMLPIAALPYRVARGLWICGSLVLFWAVSLWLARHTGPSGLGGLNGVAFLAVASLADPVRENLVQGQVYIVGYALILLAWVGYRRRRPARLGASMGGLLATKTAALALWPLVLVERRWRTLAWGLATALLLSVALLPFTGPAMWRAYLDYARQLSVSPILAATAYQSVLAFFRHLLGGGPPGFGAPIADAPTVAAVATWGTGALLLAVSLYAALRRGPDATVFSAFILLGLAVSPVSSNAHYAMALVPIALLWTASGPEARAAGEPDQLALGAFLIGTFLCVANLPISAPALHDGWRALLLYPRLYGGLLLWSCAVRMALRGARAEAPFIAAAPADPVAAR